MLERKVDLGADEVAVNVEATYRGHVEAMCRGKPCLLRYFSGAD